MYCTTVLRYWTVLYFTKESLCLFVANSNMCFRFLASSEPVLWRVFLHFPVKKNNDDLILLLCRVFSKFFPKVKKKLLSCKPFTGNTAQNIVIGGFLTVSQEKKKLFLYLFFAQNSLLRCFSLKIIIPLLLYCSAKHKNCLYYVFDGHKKNKRSLIAPL